MNKHFGSILLGLPKISGLYLHSMRFYKWRSNHTEGILASRSSERGATQVADQPRGGLTLGVFVLRTMAHRR